MIRLVSAVDQRWTGSSVPAAAITPGSWTNEQFGAEEGDDTAGAEEENRGVILLSIEMGDGVDQVDDNDRMIFFNWAVNDNWADDDDPADNDNWVIINDRTDDDDPWTTLTGSYC